MEIKRNEYIKKYYKIKEKDALILDSNKSIFNVIFARKDNAIVTDSFLLRGIARLRRLEYSRLVEVNQDALQFFSLLDAFKLLYQKGVPVYFYNRIGKEKNGFQYSELEKNRMKSGLSFPKMYEHIDQYEQELKDVFGELYSRDYVRRIGKIPQVIKVGNYYQHEDLQSEFVNVVNGKRITLNQPRKYTRTIHIYGRCGVFGYAVEDKDTIPSRLQESLIGHGLNEIKVINHGLWGGEDRYLDHNFLQDSVAMKQGDIVLFYRLHFDKKLMAEIEKCGVRYKEITHKWHERKGQKVTFFDKPGHMNAEGYKLVAELLCENLIQTGFSCGKYDYNIAVKTDYLKYYLKSKINNDFEKEIEEYVSKIMQDYPFNSEMVDNGAIVMNCNPFTKGHRYLIEIAAKQVDRLYILVVEEDKSFFKFEDRFEMVVKGTNDIPNVVVVPSGKFIISAYTFPEYFMKDYVKEKNFDVSMDVKTFCKYIAPPLNIKVRFAGEEPFDPVTKNYNENMRSILPEHGMKFIEIPRYRIDKEHIISATKVRELLKTKEYEELKEYVPESTYAVLMERYI